jgi:UDP-glucuronate decarboxylase
MKEFAELIIDLTGSTSTIEHIERPAHDHTSRMPVLDKIRALGWNNNTDLQTGIERTVEDFKMRMLEKRTYSVNTETLQPQLQS